VGNWGALAIRMHHSRFTIYGGIAMIRETAIAAAFLGFFGGVLHKRPILCADHS